MSWVVRLADDAHEFLDSLNPKYQRQVAKNISEMERDPFRGDVKALQGEKWRGCYR